MKTRKGYTLRDLGSEYILVAEGLDAVDFTRMISMNSTAAFLWMEVEGRDFDTDTLADFLIEEYGITRDVANRDVAALLKTWESANLVEY